VPIGFEASEVRFVAPVKFELPDDGKSYGYEGETAAFAQVRALPDLRPGDMYRFEVEAKWLACKERCLSESARAFIEFSVESDDEQASFEGSLAGLFEGLPRPLHELTGAEHEWRSGTLSVRQRGVRWLDFFPADPSTARLTKLEIEPENNELLLSFDGGVKGARVKGLAVTDGGQGPRFVSVDLPYEGPTD
jgi:hypothetical protein